MRSTHDLVEPAKQKKSPWKFRNTWDYLALIKAGPSAAGKKFQKPRGMRNTADAK
jgi:hypothetical protein